MTDPFGVPDIHGGVPGIREAVSLHGPGSSLGPRRVRSRYRPQHVLVRTPACHLSGFLTLPSSPFGLVVFAHGSGSSCHSPRNRAVAEFLVRAGLGTLLFDLITPPEDTPNPSSCSQHFDLDLLSDRLVGAIDWVSSLPHIEALPLGLFGSSTGAAACLKAAVVRPARVWAIVSRGGRPDLAFDVLAAVQCPTLLIVGSQDVDVLELNAWAASYLQTTHALQVIPGASHLFQEPGCLDQAASLALDWFRAHMPT